MYKMCLFGAKQKIIFQSFEGWMSFCYKKNSYFSCSCVWASARITHSHTFRRVSVCSLSNNIIICQMIVVFFFLLFVGPEREKPEKNTIFLAKIKNFHGFFTLHVSEKLEIKIIFNPFFLFLAFSLTKIIFFCVLIRNR